MSVLFTMLLITRIDRTHRAVALVGHPHRPQLDLLVL